MNRMVANTRTALKQGSRAFPMEHKSTTHCFQCFLIRLDHILFIGMRCGTMPHVRKVAEGSFVNSQMSQYFISEAFLIARFNIQHLSNVHGSFMFSLFSLRHLTTSSSGQKCQNRCSRECVPGKARFAQKFQTHNCRIDSPWLGTKVQGSSGKVPMTLG